MNSPAHDTPPGACCVQYQHRLLTLSYSGSHDGSQTNTNEAESGFPSTLYQEHDFGTTDEPSRKRVRTDEQEPDLSSFDAETLAGTIVLSSCSRPISRHPKGSLLPVQNQVRLILYLSRLSLIP